MGEPDLVGQPQLVALADPDARRRPFADTVHRHDGRFLERRREERRGRVALVVFREDVRAFRLAAERLRQSAWSVQLLTEPHRQELGERLDALRRVRQVRLHEPIELQDRFVIERDVVELVGRDPRALEAVLRRVVRERSVVLLAGETFFLSGSYDLAVAQ